MRRTLGGNVVMGLGPIASAIVACALLASGADHSLGTWKRDLERTTSTSRKGQYKSVTMTRTAVPDGSVKVITIFELKNGASQTTTLITKYDGREHPIEAASDLRFDIYATRQLDAYTFTTVAKKQGGKYHTTGRMVVSPDRQTLTVTTEGSDENGKSFKQHIVWERQ